AEGELECPPARELLAGDGAMTRVQRCVALLATRHRGEVRTVAGGFSSGWRRHRTRQRYGAQRNEKARREVDVALFDLCFASLQRTQIGDDGFGVSVRQRPVRTVRHHGEKCFAVAIDAFANGPHDLAVGPGTQTAGFVGGDVGGTHATWHAPALVVATAAGPRVTDDRRAEQVPVPLRVAAQTRNHVVDQVCPARLQLWGDLHFGRRGGAGGGAWR